MTRAARTPPVAVTGVEDVASLMRQAGGRFSAVRRVLLEVLFAADGPVSVERIAGDLELRGLHVDVTSVYRNLEHLEELGVVRHLHLGHGPGLYGLVRSGEREYLVCEVCGDVSSVPAERLDAAREHIRSETGFTARFAHFPVSGVCARCATTDPPTRRGARMSDESHSHEHSHGEEAHDHPHVHHDHEHTEHEHEHSHGDEIHSHPHTHEQGVESDHEHPH